MIELPLILAAFIAGVLMFLAPCTLPIVPGYLAFIAGVPLQDMQDPAKRRSARRSVMRNALAFVLGFSCIFILLGASAGAVGMALGPWRPLLARLAGVLLILFGLTMIGVLRLPLLSREFHVRLPGFLSLGHTSSSALIGALFALGWSPCIGPILGSILLVASNGATAGYGALLLAVFSLGLAVPFLLTAVLIGEASRYLTRIGGLVQTLSIIGGIVLVIGGILMLTNNMALLVDWGYRLFNFDSLLKYL